VEPNAQPRWRRCLAAGLFLAAFAFFLPAVWNGFVNYDDPRYLLQNPHVQHGPTLESLGWAFSSGYAANWHPLTWVSHMVDWQLSGAKPWAHHLTSVLLHALNAALLFLALRELTGSVWRSATVAALFALHPLRVESVAWVAERKDVLSGLFWMLGLYTYALWARDRRARGRRLTWYVAALACFAGGLLSKPMVVTFPAVLLLLDFWPQGRFNLVKTAKAPKAKAPAPTRPLLGLFLEKLPFFALALAAGVVTFLVQRAGGAVRDQGTFSLSMRLGNALIAYWRYLGKFVVPTGLAVLYPHPGAWPLLAVVLAGVGLVAVTFACLAQRRDRPYLAVGWLWFLGTMVPVIGLIQVGGQSMADRYTYLPLIGIAIMAVWGAAELAAFWKLRPAVQAASVSLALAACAALTVRQTLFWTDSETLFRHNIAVTGKNPLAHINLGLAVAEKGELSDAIAELHQAVAEAPEYADAHLNLGVLLQRAGDRTGAVAELTEAARLDPPSARIHLNFGLILAQAGRPDLAVNELQTAQKLDPSLLDAALDLGVVLEQLGRLDEAAAADQAALQRFPSAAALHRALASVHFKRKSWDEAAAEYQSALRLEPNDSVSHNGLGSVRFFQGRPDEAETEFRAAVALDPRNHEARQNLEGLLQSRR
jgi:Flp pilus assembly protein TadD